MRILVVEDDRSQRESLCGMLDKLGTAWVAVGDGEACLEAVADSAFDLIILDLLLPGIDGAETCRRLRAAPETRDVYVLAVTVQEQVAAFDEVMDAGANDYIIKPISLNLLRTRLLLSERHMRMDAECRRKSSDLDATQATLRRALERLKARNAKVRNVNRRLREEMDDRKLVEKASRETKDYFSKLFQMTRDSIFIYRAKDRKIIDCNEAASRLLGVPKESLYGQNSALYMSWKSHSRKRQFLTLMKADGKVEDFEADFKTRDGRALHVVLSVQSFHFAGENCLMAVLRDVTAFKQAEMKAMKTLEDKEKLNRLMTGREVIVLKLKKEINELRERLGLPSDYKTTW